MIIITIADIHNDTENMASFGPVAAKTDLVLIAGDITNFGNEKDVANVIDQIRKYNENIFAVHGNCDTTQVDNWLKQQNISLGNNLIEFKGLTLAGLGGVIPANETEEKLFNPTPKKLDIFLSHQPPYNTKIDSTSPTRHIGSQAIRNIITTCKPAIAFSGHAHEAAGIDKIGDSIIANPGPFHKGGYVYTVFDDKAKIKSCEIKNFL